MALPGRSRGEEPEWVVLLTVAVALALGSLMQMVVTSQTERATVGSMSVDYPARWAQVREEGAAFAATDLLGRGAFGPRVVLWEVGRAELLPAGTVTGDEPALAELAGAWALRRGQTLPAYRPLGSQRTTVQAREALKISYAYVSDGTRAGARGVPKVMQAVDTLVLAGDRLLVLTFAAESGEFADLGDQHERLLASWRLP